MGKKKAVAVLLAAAFSLSLPLFAIADAQAQAPAKSEQTIAAKKGHKKIAKKRVTRSAHGRTARRKA